MNDASEVKPSALTMWIGVACVFLLMALAWTAMFFYAGKHRAADVPLEKREASR